MTQMLIVAHTPLASALKAVVEHAFPDAGPSIDVLDVPPGWNELQVAAAARELIARNPGAQTLVLTDAFGATPGKGAALLADSPGVRVVVGVNVPMVWRSVCYGLDAPLDTLVERAIAGATQGVMPIGPQRPQNQPTRAAPDAQADRHDQQ
jgi:PTS system ascorbate-specific IIA component